MDTGYFDFIIYMAFESLLSYGEETSLSIEQLENYRLNILKQMKDKFNNYDSYNDNEFELKLQSYFKENDNMKIIERVNKLSLFLINHDDLFYMENGIMYVKEDVTAEEISKLKFDLDCYSSSSDKRFCEYIIRFGGNLDSLKAINAEKVKDDLLKLFRIEQNIEECYMDYQGENIINSIRIGHMLTLSKLRKLLELSCFNINKYFHVFFEIANARGNDICLSLLSNQLKNNEEFYLKNYHIGLELENKFQQAIFSDKSLVWSKIEGYLDVIGTYKREQQDEDVYNFDKNGLDILIHELLDDDVEYYEDEFDDYYEDEEIFEDVDNELINEFESEQLTKVKFYLKYIETIDNYQRNFGSSEELIKVKGRLLYLLDQYSYELYDESRLKELIDNVSMGNIDNIKDLSNFYIMSRLFLIDILQYESSDELDLRKILFASTYYDLTDDARIKRIVDKYRKTTIGNQIYDVIINHENYKPSSSSFVKKLGNNKYSSTDKK